MSAADHYQTDADVAFAARSLALPVRWTMPLSSERFRPLLWPGQVLTLTRSEPGVGDVAAILVGERVAWRRVLAVGDGVFELRSDIAPFADRWAGDVLGVVVGSRRTARLAASAPRAWTLSGWAGAVAIARARELAARARRPRRAHYSVRFAVPADVPHVTELADRAGSPSRDDPGAGVMTLVAETPAGILIGRTRLLARGDVQYSFDTLVDPAYRGLGLGTALVRRAVDHARDAGARTVHAHVFARNFASDRVYRRAGFSWTSRWWASDADPLLAADRELRELAVAIG